MSDPYLAFVEERRLEGDNPETIVKRIGEASECPVCPFCNARPATLLCDGVVGFLGVTVIENGKSKRRCVQGDQCEMFTCDRPICSECAIPNGVMFLDGPKYHEIVAHHLCPQCKDEPRDRINPISKAESVIERKRMWARSEGRLKSV